MSVTLLMHDGLLLKALLFLFQVYLHWTDFGHVRLRRVRRDADRDGLRLHLVHGPELLPDRLLRRDGKTLSGERRKS